MRYVVCILVFELATISSAVAETWDYRNADGSWTARLALSPGAPATCQFKETSSGKETAPATCTLVRSGSYVAIKQDYGAGATCVHFGQQQGHLVNGVEFCPHGGPWEFTATVTP